jgi:signal transduction histidine kinase
MNFRPSQQLSPLPLLKILEWILLATVAVVSVAVRLAYPAPSPMLLNLLGITVFAALGWVLPQRHFYKILYTAIEFSIVFLLALRGKIPLFPMLLISIVIRSGQRFEGPERLVVSVLAFSAAVALQTHRLFMDRALPIKLYSEQLMPLWIGSIMIYGLSILFLHLLVSAIKTERQSSEALAFAHDRLQKYALKIEELATLQERNRIAREIHDSLGHTLTVFNFHLEAAIRLFRSNPSKAEELLLDVKQLGDSALQEVSQSVSSLRSDPLSGQSLSDAIANLVNKFRQATGVVPHCEIDTQPDLPNQYKIAIYRIVQESLTNMCKYAAMTEARIRIEQTLRSIDVSIVDNGKGFDLHKNTTGFGLQGMRERVMLLSGQLEIVTAPNCGCQIVAVLPLE